MNALNFRHFILCAHSKIEKKKLMSIVFRGKSIPFKVEELKISNEIIKSQLFKKWLDSLDDSMNLKAITFQSVDHFSPNHIGFIKFKADIERNGASLPGVCVLRGSAVSLLIIFVDEETGQKWTVLTQQPRVPIGTLALELPAGMTDGNGDLKGVAIREVEEECGIKIPSNELINLTELAFGDKTKGIPTSGGLLDETLHLFAWQKKLKHEKILQLEGRKGGLDDHEQITLKIVPFEDLWKTTPDSKALCSIVLYEKLFKQGKIPNP